MVQKIKKKEKKEKPIGKEKRKRSKAYMSETSTADQKQPITSGY